MAPRTRLPWLLLMLCAGRVTCEMDATNSAYLEANKQKPGVIEMQSGLQYRVLTAGPKEGAHPMPATECTVRFDGRLIDGKAIGEKSTTSPFTIRPEESIKGWEEALQLMRPGDKWEITLPPWLAYGKKGMGGKVPPSSVLIYNMELIRTSNAPAEKKNLKDAYWGIAVPILLFIAIKCSKKGIDKYRDGRRYKPLPVEPDDADQADEWAYGDENGSANSSGSHGGGSHGRMESATEQLEFGVEMTDMNFSNSSNSSSSTAAVLSDQRVRRREQSHEQSRERSDSVGEEYEEQVTV